jgi:tetratricopeptide (TPR) repeat protein
MKISRIALAFSPLVFLAALASDLGPLPPAIAAEQKQTARPQIGEPVQAADQLLKQKKYKEALEKLRTADAVPDKTPYENYVIEGTRAAIALNSGDYATAEKALEAVLATGILSPQDALTRIQALVQINYQLKNYPQVATFANRYYRDGGTDEGPRLLLAQAYYLQNDFADAAKTVRQILQADDKAGKRPEENLLLMLLNSEYQQKNEAGRINVLETLVFTYPKPQYWTDLIAAIQKKPGFPNRLNLDLDRLKVATGTMKTADDYMEAAQLALLAGLPGDAKAFLDKGAASGALGKGAGAEREKRLADMANRQASNDQQSLPQLATEAGAASNGLAWVKLGDAYASYGQYDKAIDAYQKGIKKGGLQSPDDAKLHLGIAYLLSGQKAKAKESFDALSPKDATRDLAQLWLLHANSE